MVVVVVMGVCGSGKTTLGRALSAKIGCEFADADDWHPEANISKMKEGIPLSDNDRLPWLMALGRLLQRWEALSEPLSTDLSRGLEPGERSKVTRKPRVKGVLACSALKRSYRDILTSPATGQSSKVSCTFVVLNGSEEVIRERMTAREHFMPPELLRSQFEALEVPVLEEGNGLVVVGDISPPVEHLVETVLSELEAVLMQHS